MFGKFAIVFALCLTSAILFQVALYFWSISDYTSEPSYFLELDINGSTNSILNIRRLLVNTTGCKIPSTPIMPDYYKSNWIVDYTPDCSYETMLSNLTDDQIITLYPEFKNFNCCLHEIKKLDNDDHSYNMSKCQELTTSANVSQMEFLVTKCGKSLNFHANFPESTVQEKLDYWKNYPGERPPSVLMFGFDTVSRSHTFRSLPKTLRLMKKMGFVDFKGIHSVAPGTMPNFMALLVGQEESKVRTAKGCCPNWRSNFDPCPFLWQEFNQQNYITMYAEDGPQSFNWGGQGGFKKKPTDFYVHPLFSAMKVLRKENSPWGKDPYKLQCTSRETIPQFMVRYSCRFFEKFHDMPIFSLTWLSDPFHDRQLTLPTLDDELFEFFKLMESIPNGLERTLVIFFSDHGDRYSFFMTESVEGYIERSMPPLFMRFPQILKNKFPGMESAVRRNSEALTTLFDLHHTLKQILFMSKQKPHVTFEPVLADRSTFFVPIRLNRTCEEVHIDRDCCICGLSLGLNPIENKFYLQRILDFVLRELNRIVAASKYNTVCHIWKASIDKILSTRALEKTEKFTNYLIQFKTSPGDAIFQAKVKVNNGTRSEVSFDLVGTIERVSKYGNQSYCVQTLTDDDKKMKALCVCK